MNVLLAYIINTDLEFDAHCSPLMLVAQTQNRLWGGAAGLVPSHHPSNGSNDWSSIAR